MAMILIILSIVAFLVFSPWQHLVERPDRLERRFGGLVPRGPINPALVSCFGAMAVALVVAASASAQVLSHAQLAWAPVNAKPLSDKRAASLVTHMPEVRPNNQAANDYVPSNRELKTFRTAKSSTTGQTAVQENPWNAYVTGRDGLKRPSTDDLIQWTAHKWGIPEDWLRAQTVFESWWHQDWNGDLTKVPARWYMQYPPQARSTGGRVYESMGIAQIKWTPNGADGVGTGRLRWESTAFNLDYLGATIRYYYDGNCHWCRGAYHAGEQWNSIGAYNTPQPWGNARAEWYISRVKNALTQRYWERANFLGG